MMNDNYGRGSDDKEQNSSNEETNDSKMKNNSNEGIIGNEKDTNRWSGWEMNQSDKQCMEETKSMNEEYPDIQKAIQEFGKTMVVDMKDVTNMKLSFADKDVKKLRSVCSYIGGYFTLILKDDFDCDMMSLSASLEITNVANCIASTDECKNMNPLILMKNVFKSMGIKCTEKDQPENYENDKNNDIDDSKPNANDNKDNNESKEFNGNDDEDKTNGSGLRCMENSALFIDNSVSLSNATMEYQKSVIMTNPTKLGYPRKKFIEMGDVCEDESGLFLSFDSKNVTCTINGRKRCLEVYNWGNCVANTEDCKNLDPIVLVKGFFAEVLHFQCDGGCKTHLTPSGSPFHSTITHPPNTLTSSSKDVASRSSTSSSIMTGAVVLCVAAAIGFVGYYFILRSSGQERIPRRTYEMTEMSYDGYDLRLA